MIYKRIRKLNDDTNDGRKPVYSVLSANIPHGETIKLRQKQGEGFYPCIAEFQLHRIAIFLYCTSISKQRYKSSALTEGAQNGRISKPL